jgi:hypothetical protein
MVPLFWVLCGYFEYENVSGMFCRAKILIVEAGDSNKSIYIKQINKVRKFSFLEVIFV